MRTASSDESWDDDDPEAPETLWGPAQVSYEIAPGVVWYGTAGHGGLKVERRAARQLSRPALELGEEFDGAYWYEEDVLWAIPMYENPDWNRIFTRKAGGKLWSTEDLERVIRDYYPRYPLQNKTASSTSMLLRIAKTFVDQKALDAYESKNPKEKGKHKVRKNAPKPPGKMKNKSVESVFPDEAYDELEDR